MSVDPLDKFLNNVFCSLAPHDFRSDFTYSVGTYHMSNDDKQHTIEIPLPGISKENLKIDVEENMLLVETNSPLKSRCVQNIKKSWYISDTMDVNSITAKLENGLLTINIPKVKPTKKSVTVTIS
jgi:HSP20 family molecular chaperone IbpA